MTGSTVVRMDMIQPNIMRNKAFCDNISWTQAARQGSLGKGPFTPEIY